MKRILSVVTVFALSITLFAVQAQEQPKSSSKAKVGSCCPSGKSQAKKSNSECAPEAKGKKMASKDDCSKACADECTMAHKTSTKEETRKN